MMGRARDFVPTFFLTRQTGGLLIAFFLGTAIAPAATLTLDSFSSTSSSTEPANSTPWPFTMGVFGPNPVLLTELNVPGVINGDRGHVITRGNSFKGESFGFNASATFNVTGSQLTYTSTSDGAAQLQLNYGGFQPNASANGTDLAIGANAGFFTLDFSGLSLPVGKTLTILGVAFEETSPHSFQGNGTQIDVATGGAQSVVVPLPALFAANHSRIDALQLVLTPPNGASFQLDSIEFTPVPEPAGFFLASLALAGALWLGRRAPPRLQMANH